VELGGEDLGVDGLFDVCYALGTGCAATSWVAGNYAIHNLLALMFSPEAQAEMFIPGERLPRISTGFSPARASAVPADGGSVITGQWDFTSGVDSSDWVIVNVMSEQGPLAHLIPTAELEIVDTWHTVGLRGTGSKDVAAKDLFVPQHRILPLGVTIIAQTVGRELYPSPFLRLPLTSMFHVALIGSILGAANGALEVFTEQTSAKYGGLSGIQVGARPEVHHRLGEAAAEINAARLAVRATFAEMREMGAAEVEPSVLDRTRWRRDAAWAAKIAVQATDRLYAVGGAHSLFVDDQLAQYHRDVTAGSHHYGLSYDMLFAAHGQARLGQEPTVPML
jgi:3-hydroxy-9,10-secoandrosta-1,3,5(10)-triene-9,17-dione monooxygenase